MNENNFGKFLKQLRNERNLSQEKLADDLYVHRTTVNKWESGKVIPLNDKLLDIANYFNVSIDELLNGSRNSGANRDSNTSKAIIELIKSKRMYYKFNLILIISCICLILSFLVYYFIKTYKSINVLMFYGANENIKTRDGLIILLNDKLYFKPGNFYNNKDEIIDIDFIELYMFKDNEKRTLLMSDSNGLFVELSTSLELNIELFHTDNQFYLDACYDGICEQIIINSADDYNNDVVAFSKSRSLKEEIVDLSVTVSSLGEQLLSYGFNYDSINNNYYLKTDDIEYYYYDFFKIICIKLKKEEKVISIMMLQNKLEINYVKEGDKDISKEYNLIDDGFDLYNEIKNDYLYPYFKGFI